MSSNTGFAVMGGIIIGLLFTISFKLCTYDMSAPVLPSVDTSKSVSGPIAVSRPAPLAFVISPPAPIHVDDPFRVFLNALMAVESGGDPNAVGNGGEQGVYQIKYDHWIHALKGTHAEDWPYIWVRDKNRSEYVLYAHWFKVCPDAMMNRDYELLARHHRLPYAPWRASNDSYWLRVKAEMEQN